MSLVRSTPIHIKPQLSGQTSRFHFSATTPLLLALLIGSAASASPSTATISKSVDVSADAAAVWSYIGPFCAIKNWLPPVGSCAEDGQNKPTRTLVTKDRSATFVELRTKFSDNKRSYSYTFVSSPVPVTKYASTIQVIAKGNGMSTVIWRATYVPNEGKEKDANDALNGIYQAGLDQIKANFVR